MTTGANAFESWAVLELMGHVRTAGKVSEVELFGTKMGRIEVPVGEGWVTQFFGGSSVYRLTPCGEEEARAVARHNQSQPVHPWEVQKSLPMDNPDDEDRCDDEDDREIPY